jgi:hypothetical protein
MLEGIFNWMIMICSCLQVCCKDLEIRKLWPLDELQCIVMKKSSSGIFPVMELSPSRELGKNTAK